MEEFFFKHKIKDKVIAVAVSGGADSLALVLMAEEQLAALGVKIVALTVDHGLRPTSADEAKYVAKIAAKHGIAHHILHWDGEKPDTGLEEAARSSRYKLLKDWCLSHNIKCLMVAHHLHDQAETFLMRLQRGSGLEGLCCMREVTEWEGLTVLRPLLHTDPQVMKDYLLKRNIKWIIDESNDDESFLRNKIRKFIPEFTKKTGINITKIDNAVTCLQSAENYIETQVNSIVEQQVKIEFTQVSSFKYTDYLTWHPEIKFRILARLCKREYIPRAESILSIIQKLNCLPFEGVTLGEKEIFLSYGRVWIVPEMQAKHKSSRKQWKEFVLQNSNYANRKIPHKARLAILRQWNKYDI